MSKQKFTIEDEATLTKRQRDFLKLLSDKKLLDDNIIRRLPRNKWIITKDWIVDGIGGLSCWTECVEDDQYEIEPEDEPEFDELNRIVYGLIPNISEKDFNDIKLQCITINDKYKCDDDDYYGNYTMRCSKSLNVLKVFDLISDKI